MRKTLLDVLHRLTKRSSHRFWIFYRAKEDGMAVLGFEHPWEHGHGGHDDHHDHSHSNHGDHSDHGHGETSYSKGGIGETPEVA